MTGEDREAPGENQGWMSPGEEPRDAVPPQRPDPQNPYPQQGPPPEQGAQQQGAVEQFPQQPYPQQSPQQQSPVGEFPQQPYPQQFPPPQPGPQQQGPVGQFSQQPYPQQFPAPQQFPQQQGPAGQLPQNPYPQQPPQYPQPSGQQYPYAQQPYPQPYQPPQQQAQQPQPQQPYPPQAYPWPTTPQQQVSPSSSGSSAGKRTVPYAVAALVVACAVAGALVFANSSHSGPTSVAAAQSQSAGAGTPGSSASASPAAGASASPQGAAAQCVAASNVDSEPVGYHACGAAARDVGVPTYDARQARRTFTVTLTTNRGAIVFTANGIAAPYTVYSFVYLIGKHYFDDTGCHRLTTAGIYVLQCGDPTGTGTGGPGYAFQDENLASLGKPGSDGTVTYGSGTVAMANAGPDTNGSQFFLVYKNSPIPPGYTPFGTITQGLDIIQQVARAGTNNANGTGDGAPNEAVRIESVAVR